MKAESSGLAGLVRHSSSIIGTTDRDRLSAQLSQHNYSNAGINRLAGVKLGDPPPSEEHFKPA